MKGLIRGFIFNDNLQIVLLTRLFLFKKMATSFCHNWPSSANHAVFKRQLTGVIMNSSFRFYSLRFQMFTVVTMKDCKIVRSVGSGVTVWSVRHSSAKCTHIVTSNFLKPKGKIFGQICIRIILLCFAII